MINKVVIGGRIVSDPEVQAVPPMLSMLLEVEHVSASGEYHEECEVRAVLFGARRVEALQEWLTRDRAIAVTGHLQAGQGGLSIVVDQLQFLPDQVVSTPLWVAPGAGVAVSA